MAPASNMPTISGPALNKWKKTNHIYGAAAGTLSPTPSFALRPPHKVFLHPGSASTIGLRPDFRYEESNNVADTIGTVYNAKIGGFSATKHLLYILADPLASRLAPADVDAYMLMFNEFVLTNGTKYNVKATVKIVSNAESLYLEVVIVCDQAPVLMKLDAQAKHLSIHFAGGAGLMTLPRELRQHIYDYLFDDVDVTAISASSSLKKYAVSLRTLAHIGSIELRNEVIGHYLHRVDLIETDLDQLFTRLTNIGRAATGSLRRIVVYINGFITADGNIHALSQYLCLAESASRPITLTLCFRVSEGILADYEKGKIVMKKTTACIKSLAVALHPWFSLRPNRMLNLEVEKNGNALVGADLTAATASRVKLENDMHTWFMNKTAACTSAHILAYPSRNMRAKQLAGTLKANRNLGTRRLQRVLGAWYTPTTI